MSGKTLVLLVAGAGALSLLATPVVMRSVARASLPKFDARAFQPSPPVTAHFQEILTKAGYPTVISQEIDYAARKDGSTSRFTRQFSLAGAPLYSRRELDLAGDIQVRTEEELRLVTAVKVPGRDRGRAVGRWDPVQSCGVAFDTVNRMKGTGVRESMLGFEVVKYVDDGPNVRLTHWLSPALGCLELRRLAEFKSADGSIDNTSDLVATSVVQGDPDERMFAFPQGYEPASFLDAGTRFETWAGRTLSPAAASILQKHDDVYAKYRYSGQ